MDDGNDFVLDVGSFRDCSASSMNSSMSSVTMFTDFEEDSFGTIASGDSFLRAPGGWLMRTEEGNNRMFFQAQHDHMPMKPRRSTHRDVYTEKEDQRPVMPKRDLSNSSLSCTDDEIEEEDSKTVSSYESKGSAVIAESLKSKPDSNHPPALDPVVSSKPCLPKPRQLPAQTERSAAIAESLKSNPPSNLPYLALAASSQPFPTKLKQIPAQSERAAVIADSLRSKPDSNIPFSVFSLAASVSEPFLPNLRQRPAQSERSAAIVESLIPKPASSLPYSDLAWAASSKALKRKGSKSDVSLEEEGAWSIAILKNMHSNGFASTYACPYSEEGSSARKFKKEKKKKFKSPSREKKSSKKEKEGDGTSSKDPFPRRVSEPRQRRFTRPPLTRSQQLLLGKKRSVMSVRWSASADQERLRVILEDTEEEEDDRSLQTCSF